MNNHHSCVLRYVWLVRLIAVWAAWSSRPFCTTDRQAASKELSPRVFANNDGSFFLRRKEETPHNNTAAAEVNYFVLRMYDIINIIFTQQQQSVVVVDWLRVSVSPPIHCLFLLMYLRWTYVLVVHTAAPEFYKIFKYWLQEEEDHCFQENTHTFNTSNAHSSMPVRRINIYML